MEERRHAIRVASNMNDHWLHAGKVLRTSAPLDSEQQVS